MNKLKTWTIVLNFFVIVGAGHGVATVGIFGIWGFKELISGDFVINIMGDYEERLRTGGLISVVGQFILLISYLTKNLTRTTLTVSGCAVLFIATYILTRDAREMNLEMFTLLCSVPYILTSLILAFKEISLTLNR